MKTQDNEFDELFRSKLDNFEAEPSGHVWEKVNNELNTGKRKKIWPPILGIAATVLVLIVSGVLFISPKRPANNTFHRQVKVVKTPPLTSKQPAAIINASKLAGTSIRDSKKGHETTVNNVSPVKTTKYSRFKNAGILTDTAHTKNGENQSLAALPQQVEKDIIKPVVPDNRTQIAIDQSIEEMASIVNKPALIAVEIPATDKPDIIPAKSKHKIRTLGDLINVVVAKVDKRKDKIIEFSDTDDESNITGVNLGIIKLKKDQ